MFVGILRVPLVVLAVLAALVAGCGSKQEQAQGLGAGGPPPVSVAPVTRRQVEEFDEFSARVAAVDQIDVRARVAGTLERVHFRDGQEVRKGMLLLTIDPRPFAAEVARQTATLASASSQASLANLQVTRAERLQPLRAIFEQGGGPVSRSRAECHRRRQRRPGIAGRGAPEPERCPHHCAHQRARIAHRRHRRQPCQHQRAGACHHRLHRPRVRLS